MQGNVGESSPIIFEGRNVNGVNDSGVNDSEIQQYCDDLEKSRPTPAQSVSTLLKSISGISSRIHLIGRRQKCNVNATCYSCNIQN
jgi:hypothetical protein